MQMSFCGCFFFRINGFLRVVNSEIDILLLAFYRSIYEKKSDCPKVFCS